MRLYRQLLFTAFLAASISGVAAGKIPEVIRYNRDIRPILSNNCFLCHGPDKGRRKADLRLDLEAVAKEIAIVPGKPSESELWARITNSDIDERMPPKGSKKGLNSHQIALLKKWIEQGAKYEGHWAFITPKQPALPQLKVKWGNNPIDAFVAAKLQADGLRPSSQAAREILIRRVSFDLTGLPPTLKELDDFLNDKNPKAYEKVVDRLLASTAYAERMTLHWMDVARYGDSSVHHADGPRTMWPWRDWVINALNSNMPFDQFTIAQLAGDLLPAATNSQIVATGFNRNHGVTASGISEEYRVEYVLDRVRTTSTVWLGLTMQCAQCHDHKYDPISQAEFYQFFAYFNTITDKGVENRSGNVDPLITVESLEFAATLAKLKQQLSKLEQAKQRRDLAVGPELDLK